MYPRHGGTHLSFKSHLSTTLNFCKLDRSWHIWIQAVYRIPTSACKKVLIFLVPRSIMGSTPSITPSLFLQYGRAFFNKSATVSKMTDEAHVLQLLESFRILCQKFASLSPLNSRRRNTYHMLWALLKLRTYGTDLVCAFLAGVDRKTFSKWTWTVIKRLAKLSQVRLLSLP